MNPLRTQVLTLYRTILRSSRRDWSEPKHRAYIRQEARDLFRRYRSLTDQKTIQSKVQEGYDRMELATHYGSPYARQSHSLGQTAETSA